MPSSIGASLGCSPKLTCCAVMRRPSKDGGATSPANRITHGECDGVAGRISRPAVRISTTALPHDEVALGENIERKLLPSIQPSALLEKNNPIDRQYRTLRSIKPGR